jgi:hypothetical protein
MIKRLTDDPMKLNDAVPGASFPPRLQVAMDRALARMPGERYASAAEFARDVSTAVQGMPGGGATAPADGDATQVISAHDAKTAAIQATRVSESKTRGAKTAVATPPTPAPRTVVTQPAEKKKPVGLIAAVIGVLVVGGGAAAVMMNKGSGSSGNTGQVQTPVTGNTANPNTASNTSTPTGGKANPTGNKQTGGNPTNTTTNPNTGRNQQVVTNNPPPAGVDSAALDQETFSLFEQLDDATKVPAARRRLTDIYSAATNPKTIRADAASYISTVYQSEGKGDEACQWIDRALALRPGWSSYTKIRSRLACS